MTFWKSDQTNQTDGGRYWQPNVVRARPIEIQVTSYALLAYAAKGLVREGMSILHWLTRQRNPHGGFVSTQVGDWSLAGDLHKNRDGIMTTAQTFHSFASINYTDSRYRDNICTVPPEGIFRLVTNSIVFCKIQFTNLYIIP